jgi:hypothetical protein
MASGTYFLNVYLDTELYAPAPLIGALAGLPAILSIAVTLSIPWVISRWGQVGGIQRANALRLLAYISWAAVPHWLGVAAGRLVMVAGGIGGVLLTMFSLSQVDAEWRPTLQGASMLALGLGMAGMAALGGSMAEAWGYRTVFAVAGGLTAILSLLLWTYDRFAAGQSIRTPAPATPEAATESR